MAHWLSQQNHTIPIWLYPIWPDCLQQKDLLQELDYPPKHHWTVCSETLPHQGWVLLTESPIQDLRSSGTMKYSFEMVGDILLLIVFSHNAALDHVVTSHEGTQMENKLTFAVFSEMNKKSLWESWILNFLSRLSNISPACKPTTCYTLSNCL